MKVLVAGVGSIGQRHIRNLRRRLGAGVEILAYRVRGRSHVLSDDMKIIPGHDVEAFYGLHAYSDLDEALSQRPDAVIVCNPSSLHVPVALAAARAGSHMLVEKPLSHTYDGIPELLEVVEKNGLVGMVGYQLRFHPALQSAKRLLDQGAVGRIRAARLEVAEHLADAHPYEDYRESYAARSDLGGGVILSFIHELDIVYWLIGMPRSVHAVGGHLSRLEMDVEDTAAITLSCILDDRRIPVQVFQDFQRRPPQRSIQILGETGQLLVDLREQSVRLIDDSGTQVLHQEFANHARNQLFVDELDHFLDCIAGRAKPLVTLADGAQTLRISLAAREALRTGEVVNLD